MFIEECFVLRVEPTVFVVDDDISVRESLDLLIQSLGWRSEIFSSVQDFQSFARVRGPSCLILDISLPDLSGFGLQRLIASDLVGMPVIVITGSDERSLGVRAMKAGAFEFLVKPFESERLLKAIERAIEHNS